MSDPKLELRGIKKNFGNIVALDGVDLTVNGNEVLGLAGDNGAGKSTLIKCIVGVHTPNDGEIRIDGDIVTISDPDEAQKNGIATVYQDLALIDELSVGANVFLGRIPKKNSLMGLDIVDWEQMNERAESILSNQLGINIDPTQNVEFLSGGERQAVAIARALVTDPDILIMDEPTAALSKTSQENVMDLIETLQDQGMTIILISHSMEELLDLTDRITVIHSGEDVNTVPTTDTTKEEIVSMMLG